MAKILPETRRSPVEGSLLGGDVQRVDRETLASLRERRRARLERLNPAAVRAAALDPGSRWELRVQAGGPHEVLVPPALSLSSVAALGSVTSGVGYVEVGADVLLPDDDDNGRRPALEDLLHIQEPILDAIRDTLNLEITDPPDGGVESRHFAWDPDSEYGGLCPARTRTAVLLGRDTDGVLDVSSLFDALGVASGRPWAAYGVALVLARGFPFPDSGDRTVAPVERQFWASASEVLQRAAASVSLPVWPLNAATLISMESPRAITMNWGSQWSRPPQ